MSLLKKLRGIGGALTLSAAMAAGSPEKAEAHHPHYYYPGPVVHQTIGPFGGVWTRTFVPGPVWTPAPVFVRPAPRMIIVPSAPVYVPYYVQPAPIYVYPCW